MAVDIGPRIGIEGEAEYRRQLDRIITQSKTLHAEMRQMESAWNKDTTAKQKVAQQTQMLNNQIEVQTQRIDELKRGLEESKNKFGENDKKTLKWRQALANAETELNRLQAQLRELPNNVQLVGKSMQETGAKIESVGKKISSVGSGLTKSVTVPLAAMATAAVKTTASFDSSMSKVAALSGATGEDFDTLRNKAREMGATTRYSAGEAADALSYMALAGWDTNQMVEGLDGVLNLAASSGMDLAAASDLVTDYLSAFGLEAKDSARMADQLAYAQAHSNTTTTQLGEAFGNTAAQMHTAGQSMETTTAILEAFANQGLKGSEAGTALSAMVRDITQKMRGGKIQIGKTSVTVQDANGNFRKMTDILADVEKATEGMGSAEKSAALMTTFTARSVKGVSMALTEGVGNIRLYENQLYSAGGTAKNMAEVMQDNLSGQLTILKSQVQELGISFGDILVPKIRSAVSWVQQQVDKFNAMDKATKENVVKFGMLAAAIGPVLMVTGKLVTATGSIISAGGKVVETVGSMIAKHTANAAAATADATATVGATAATKGFNTALKASPIGAVALAITAAVLAIKALQKGFNYIQKSARDANKEMYSTIDAVDDSSDAMVEAAANIRKGFADSAKAISEVEASAKAATQVAGEIETLTNKTKLNADEQARLKVLVAEMNSIYPAMGLAIDETGNSLNRSTEEIKGFIQESYNMAKAAAYTQAVKDALQAMAEAELEVAKAEIERERLMSQLGAAEQEEQARVEALTNAMEGMDDVSRELYQSGTELAGGTGVQTVAMRKANKALEENQAAMDECNAVMEEAQTNYDLSNAALEKLAEELGVSVEELTGMATASDEVSEAALEMGESVSQAGDEVSDAIEEMNESYMKAKETARDSVMSQKSLFQELEAQEATSIEAMRKGLESHIKAYQEWNENAQFLMNDSRYGMDENFTAMVNSLVAAGRDMAPEVAAIVQGIKDGDTEIADLIQDYGEMSKLADEASTSMAEAQVAMEYGVDGLVKLMEASGDETGSAYIKSFDKSVKGKKIAQPIVDGLNSTNARIEKLAAKDAKTASEKYSAGAASGITATDTSAKLKLVEDAFSNNLRNIQSKAPFATTAGKDVVGAVASGANAMIPNVTTAMTNTWNTVGNKITEISNLKGKAQTAGSGVSGGVASGITSQKGNVTAAAEGIRSVTDGKIVAISNLKAKAQSAGSGVSGAVATGVKSNQSNVTNAATGVTNAVKTGVQNVNAQAGPGRAAGSNVGANIAAGYDSQKGATNTAGKNLGNNFASGLSSTQGNVNASARSLSSGADSNIKADKDNAYTWGAHMGDNFAAGLSSKLSAITQAATNIAQRVANIMKHTTPKTGPLKDDDVWGIHMGENFAQGMVKSIPAVKTAATELAEAAVLNPVANPYVDSNIISGATAAADNILTQEEMYEAFAAALDSADMSVVIGRREFGRILREYGAIA